MAQDGDSNPKVDPKGSFLRCPHPTPVCRALLVPSKVRLGKHALFLVLPFSRFLVSLTEASNLSFVFKSSVEIRSMFLHLQ